MAEKTILVVDDSRVARMMTGAAIGRLRPGWTIIEAGSGEEALIRAVGAPPDLVLLDVNMPGMGGMCTARRLRQDFPLARISLLTANIQDPIRHQAEEIGVGFMIKPLDASALTSFLDGEPHRS